MRFLSLFGAAALAALLANPALAKDCSQPEAPELPDGKSASAQEMLTAQKKVKGYINEGRQYLGCVKTQEMALGEDAPEDKRKELLDNYNGMVENMKVASTDFNSEVKAFRAAQEEEAE